MDCGNCDQCNNTTTPADFELAMDKAGEILKHIAEHLEHPQAERLLAPNRVAVRDVYLGVAMSRETPGEGRIFIWETDVPDAVPVLQINSQHLGVVEVDYPRPTFNTADMKGLMDSFDDLLQACFFQG